MAACVGTLLVVAGGIALAAEGEPPVDYRACGAALAVSVAVAFGLRDNVARAVTEDVAADPLAQTTAIMLGASLVLLANLLRVRSPLPRLRAAFGPSRAPQRPVREGGSPRQGVRRHPVILGSSGNEPRSGRT